MPPLTLHDAPTGSAPPPSSATALPAVPSTATSHGPDSLPSRPTTRNRPTSRPTSSSPLTSTATTVPTASSTPEPSDTPPRRGRRGTDACSPRQPRPRPSPEAAEQPGNADAHRGRGPTGPGRDPGGPTRPTQEDRLDALTGT